MIVGNIKDRRIYETAHPLFSQAFDFIKKAFKKADKPHLKRYAVIDLAVIVTSLLKVYDLSNYSEKFGDAFLKFSNERILNAEKPEDEQDQRLIRYSNATRGDSLEYLEYRQKVLKEYILEEMPYLELKDQNRIFTPDQRAVIYRIGKGKCAICGIDVSEVEPKSCVSKLCENLYFAGEVIDIAGDLGGFNLHWAWASGHAAGTQSLGQIGSIAGGVVQLDDGVEVHAFFFYFSQCRK